MGKININLKTAIYIRHRFYLSNGATCFDLTLDHLQARNP